MPNDAFAEPPVDDDVQIPGAYPWDGYFTRAKLRPPKATRISAIKISLRLRERLNLILQLDVQKVSRTYHGSHQRSAGAWSWVAYDTNGAPVCGSPDTMKMCLKDLDLVEFK